MDLFEKISILGPNAQYDTCGPKDFGETSNIPGVYKAKVGGSKVCRLFKVLQTNKCINNCKYCAMRRDRNIKRTEASPDEMAKAFDSAYARRLVDGFFLSSGIDNDPNKSMNKMIDTAHIVRNRYNYKGYLHLKIMPGTAPDLIEEAVRLSNRVSINMEAPTENSLMQLSPSKRLKTIFWPTLHTIKNEINKLKYGGVRSVPSLTTQFVVGADEENDLEYIKMTNILYKRFNLKRVFFSAFRPVSDTPLEEKSPVSMTREHRLYQADFLMRFYKFSPLDIPLDKHGFLLENTDPKMAWAKNHPEFYPVNLNSADYWKLIKVPGIGPVTARKIIKLRKESKIFFLEQLSGMRIQVDKLSSFVTV